MVARCRMNYIKTSSPYLVVHLLGGQDLASLRELEMIPAKLSEGEAPQRVIQIQGRFKSSESPKEHTRNNPEDAGMVSRSLPQKGED